MIIETGRLLLRRFNLNDAPFIIELLNSPGWLQFIGNKSVRSIEDAQNYLQKGPLKSYEIHGFGLNLVQKKDDGCAIGMCGVLKRDTLEYPDLGFAFLPRHTGNGYAFEAASSILTYAAEKLDIRHITALTIPSNSRSIKLLEKLSFVFSRAFSFEVNGELLYQYDRELKKTL